MRTSTQVSLPEYDQVVDALPPDVPISRSAKPFCNGEPAEIGLSRMPMARRRWLMRFAWEKANMKHAA